MTLADRRCRWLRRSPLLAVAVAACGPAPATPASPAPTPAAASEPAGQTVPTRHDEDRFFARPVAARTGETLDIYLDTGGNNFLYADVADRLALERVTLGEGEDTYIEVKFPALAAGSEMPLPHTREGRVLLFERDADSEGWSGMLGPEWFGGRCWLFDYPGKHLVLLSRCDERAAGSAHTVPLGFGDGLWFPRIQVTIDGEVIDLLFDTGAMTNLTPTAVKALADGRAAARATSFIARAVFDRWHRKHPAWRVIEAAEAGTGAAMIEVPQVEVAGYTVGPVWFTVRPDPNFHQFMSQWMDRRIDGALGGNALRQFRIVADYPHARARFDRK